MQKVFIKAYAKQNLGDDLFIKMLLDRYPQTVFYLNAPEEYKKNIFKDYPNLEIFQSNENNFIKKIQGFVYRKISKNIYKNYLRNKALKEIQIVREDIDAFISIGGSIFMQPRFLPLYYDVEYYNCINEIFSKQPKLYLGCNFGPYSDPLYKKGYENIFSKAYDVCFREEYSFKQFENIDVVRYAPDIVFGLQLNQEKKRIKRSVGFSIVQAKKQSDNHSNYDYVQEYATLINKFIKDDYKIKLFSFCKDEGDELIINEIKKLLVPKESQLKEVFYDGNIDAFLMEYASVETIFCGRFHAIIISLILKQNIVPVIYSNKMLNVLSDINFKGIYLDIDKLKEAKYEDLIQLFSENTINVEEIQIDSNKHFEKLDSLIK